MPACSVSKGQMSPMFFPLPCCRPTMPSISVRHSCVVIPHSLSALSTRHCPLGSRGEFILPFVPRVPGVGVPSLAVDGREKKGMNVSSFHMSPASLSVTVFVIYMFAGAVAWLKDDMIHTGTRLRISSELLRATGRPGCCSKYRRAHTSGKGDRESPSDPLRTEQVWCMLLRTFSNTVQGHGIRANDSTPLLPSRFRLLYGLNGWLMLVVVLLGYGVCKTTKKSDGSPHVLLWQPLCEVPRGMHRGPNPLARAAPTGTKRPGGDIGLLDPDAAGGDAET